MDKSVFDCFRRQVPFEDLEFYHDFMGVRIRKGLEVPRDSALESPSLKGGFPVGQMSSGRATRMCADDPTMLHPDCEDFFEWTDMLTALINAGPTFQMIEVGAGFGRWCTNAIVASRRMVVRARPIIKTFAIEVDPFKVRFLNKHLVANHAVGECAVQHAIIDYSADTDMYFGWYADKFLVPLTDVANSYGNGIVRSKDMAQHLGKNPFGTAKWGHFHCRESNPQAAL